MMDSMMTRYARLTLLPLLFAALVGAAGAACSGNPKTKLPPAGSAEPDKFLFDRGNEELAKKHWFAAREYFRNVVDRYPQSAVRPDAKLALGDTYLLENSSESRVLAVNDAQQTDRARRAALGSSSGSSTAASSSVDDGTPITVSFDSGQLNSSTTSPMVILSPVLIGSGVLSTLLLSLVPLALFMSSTKNWPPSS